jgi:phosphoribosyl-AMP cyclohydrolase
MNTQASAVTGARCPSALDPEIAARLKRDAAGLVPAVAQQYDTGEVLMVGWMDDEALHLTLTTGRCTYWSRSRQEYWVKGGTSGHVQQVKAVALDCDGDTVLVKVDQTGGACHTGDRTCFDADPLPATVAASGTGVNGGAMTAPEPVAEPLGTRRPAAGARREHRSRAAYCGGRGGRAARRPPGLGPGGDHRAASATRLPGRGERPGPAPLGSARRGLAAPGPAWRRCWRPAASSGG